MNSRDKGQRNERLFRDYLRERGYAEAERGQQRKGGPDSPDVLGGPAGYHFEVKGTRYWRPYDAMDQAIRDAGPNVPIVGHLFDGRKPGARGLWLGLVRMDDLMDAIEAAKLIKDIRI